MGRGWLLSLGLVALPFAAMGAAVAYDQQEHNLSYRVDSTFNGDLAVVEIDRGKLGLGHREKIVGYFLAGAPRAIGFGCVGAKLPIIAMSAGDLPKCRRVAPIEEIAR